MDQANARIRAALRGQTLLVVGGDRRQEQLARLRNALEVEVIYCPTRRSDASSRAFRCQINRNGIVLVVCVVGLCRTDHCRKLHQLCRQLGIPWIDCHRIPHPNALEAAIEERRLASAITRRARLVSAAGSPGRTGVSA